VCGISSWTTYSVLYLQWLKKQAEARRTADIEDSDLTEEEKNPMIMKEKAE